MKLLAALLGAALCACSSQQESAVSAAALKAEPVVFGTCGLVETAVDVLDPAGAPVVTIACTAAEDIDGALAKLASQGVTQVRIVCPLKPIWARDGGKD